MKGKPGRDYKYKIKTHSQHIITGQLKTVQNHPKWTLDKQSSRCVVYSVVSDALWVSSGHIASQGRWKL